MSDLAEIAGAAVWRVVWSWPEGDWLFGARADGEVLLYEELVFARVDLSSKLLLAWAYDRGSLGEIRV